MGTEICVTFKKSIVKKQYFYPVKCWVAMRQVKQWVFWLLIVVNLYFAGIGCKQQERPAASNVIRHPLGNFTPYQAQLRNFKVNLPYEWTVKEYELPPAIKASISSIAEAQTPEYAENFTFEAIPLATVYNLPKSKTDSIPPFNLRTLAQWFFEDLQLKSTEYKIIEVGETLVNGVHAAQFMYVYKNPQEYAGELKALTFLVTQNNEAWLFTCTEAGSNFNKKKKKFEYILQSIRFVYR